MERLRLFAVEEDGPRALPAAAGATQFADLYRGLALGVYTALRTFDHDKFLYLHRHLDRTERSMALLGWEYRLDRARLRRALHEVVSASEWPEMRVRIDVLAAAATALGTDSRELIALQAFSPPPAALYETGVAVDFATGLARERPLAKTADFAEKRPVSGGLQQLEGQAGETHAAVTEPYEYLLLSADGHILEGTGTNFWAVRDGVVLTAGEGVLEGITRAILLRLIAELGIPLELKAVRVDDVPALDEAALSGSSRAFLPVVRIGGQVIGGGNVGPISRRILAAYTAFVAQHLEIANSR